MLMVLKMKRGVHLSLCETNVAIETPNVKDKADQRAKLYISLPQTPGEPYMQCVCMVGSLSPHN